MRWEGLVLVLLAGCSAHSGVHVGAGQSVAHSGVQLHLEGGGDLASVLGLAILGAGMLQYEAQRKSERGVPRLAPDRRINEQDCSQPIKDPSANLKCR